MFNIILALIVLSCISCGTSSHRYYQYWFKNFDMDLAIKQFLQEKQMYPLNSEPYYYLGLCYLKKANLTKKDEYYKKAIIEIKHAYKLENKIKIAIALLNCYKSYGDKLFNENKIEESLKIYREYIIFSEEYIFKKIK